MYIIILLRYISYAYNISSACESNWMELPINLFIIIMYQMIVFINYNNFFNFVSLHLVGTMDKEFVYYFKIAD